MRFIMITHLVKHGRSRAVVIDEGLLQAAGLDKDALFQIIISPNGGLLMQSVERPTSDKKLENTK